MIRELLFFKTSVMECVCILEFAKKTHKKAGKQYTGTTLKGSGGYRG